jgi:AraC family transcriptional regulator, transcriptional activator of pobA
MSKAVVKYDFKGGLEHEFEIIDAAKLYKEHKDILTEPHRTNFYHILWFENGEGIHLIDFKPIKIQPNSLVFVGRNKVQRFESENHFIY